MPQYLKDLIEKISEDDLPTNIFTIEDEDPMVILGKINEVIALLKKLEATINASDTKALEALKKAEESLQNSKDALEKSIKVEESATTAVDTANHAEQLAQQAYNDVEQAVENAKTALADAQNAVASANQAVEDAQKAVDTANGIDAKAQKALDATDEQQKEITAIKAKDVEQDGEITAIKDKNTAQDELLKTYAENLQAEVKTRADEDTAIRDEITRLMTGESEINEEIRKDIDSLKTTKADETATNTRFATNETHLSNIDAEQKTQNNRLTALESKNVEQDKAIEDTNTKIDEYVENNDLAVASLSNQIIDLQEKDAEHEDKITLLEHNDSNMLDMIDDNTNEITAIKTKNSDQDTEISSIKDKNTAQDTAISKAQTTADGAVTKNTQQDTSISALETMLGATQKDLTTKDAQNVKLTGDQSISGVKTFNNDINAQSNLNVYNLLKALTRYGNAFELHYDGNTGIELGRKDGTKGGAYIDFHTDGNEKTDYNARIIATSAGIDIKGADGLSINGRSLINTIYPVGSVYLSVNDVSPATFIGGTWEQLNGGYALTTTKGTPDQSTTDASHHKAGEYYAGGLPNLEGYFGRIICRNSENHYSGFTEYDTKLFSESIANANRGYFNNSTGGYAGPFQLRFNAHNYSSLYGQYQGGDGSTNRVIADHYSIYAWRRLS